MNENTIPFDGLPPSIRSEYNRIQMIDQQQANVFLNNKIAPVLQELEHVYRSMGPDIYKIYLNNIMTELQRSQNEQSIELYDFNKLVFLSPNYNKIDTTYRQILRDIMYPPDVTKGKPCPRKNCANPSNTVVVSAQTRASDEQEATAFACRSCNMLFT